MFGKQKLLQKMRIEYLENLICPQNKHEYFITQEYLKSDYAGGHIDVWTERLLTCSKCGKRVVDSNRMTGFKYKVSEG